MFFLPFPHTQSLSRFTIVLPAGKIGYLRVRYSGVYMTALCRLVLVIRIHQQCLMTVVLRGVVFTGESIPLFEDATL